MRLTLGRQPAALATDIRWQDKVVVDAFALILTDGRNVRRDVKISEHRRGSDSQGNCVDELSAEPSAPRGFRTTIRVHSWPRVGLLKLDIAIHNEKRARHAGGVWDLGDPGSILFKEFALELRLHELPTGVALRPERSAEWLRSNRAAFELYQDSSGGRNWQSRNHANREGRIPCRVRGYRLRVGDTHSEGLRAEPMVVVSGREGAVAVAVAEFWQQFPKAIALDGQTLRVSLFPRQWDDLHEIQGGERKTHTVWLKFGSDFESLRDCVLEPVIVRPSGEWIERAAALPPLDLPQGEARTRFESYLKEALESPGGILANREGVDEYGWRNYGDLFADHEEAYYTGREPLVSHYNNQFDPLLGFLLQFVRAGGRRWFELADALARHVADIDIYHTRRDRAAYNGGLFWFTDHYLHAATSTHRSYSRSNARPGSAYGGGPSSSHLFTTGLRVHHLLTGNPSSAAAVVELADWVLAMDDGRNTLLGVLDDGPTGAASSTGDLRYHGPGRGAGNSVNALLDAWGLTGRRHYLDYAEQLIRRVIHPADDVNGRDLLNAEKRWSYTVFLTSLAKYVDLKAEANELDFMYAYAQSTLLHYGGWMLKHERPYFDQVEKLEYPTEVWAAQELRKANVLRHAARFADEPLRAQMLKRGEELADRAWSDLLRFKTRTAIRAVAIVMIEGLWDCAYRAGLVKPGAKPPRADFDFGRPTPFVPQRQRVLRSLRRPFGLVRAVGRLLSPWRWLGVRWRLR